MFVFSIKQQSATKTGGKDAKKPAPKTPETVRYMCIVIIMLYASLEGIFDIRYFR